MSQSNAVTRRKFLGGAVALSAAGFAAPCLIPSGLLAAPGRPGPNDRIGIAGIGVGRQGSGVFGGAARLGRRLKWDPVKETFPDDAEANTYLDRPRRKPYELPAEV